MSQGKVHFPTPGGQEVWTWKAGRESIVIRNPGRRKWAVHMWEILGCTPYEVERIQWKGGRGVTPADVKDYISKNLRKAQ